MKEWFHKFANKISDRVGSPWSFMLAVAVIAVWALTGPVFKYSDTWQLIINTGTTIVTFLMVFLIQNTQNRDAKAIHLKLDELLKAVEGARTSLVDLEDLPDEELTRLQKEFQHLHMRQVLHDHLALEVERGKLAKEHAELADEHDTLEQEHRALGWHHAYREPRRHGVRPAHPEPVDDNR